MTEILCRWLNDDVQLSSVVEPSSFVQDFSNGYLIGELLCKHNLQDDFEQFSRGSSSESKLNNFTRLEPVLKLLGVPFNTNMAREVMMERHGAATRLMYQLFISLNRSEDRRLTYQSLEAMKPMGKTKLDAVESTLYKKRLAHQTKRQVDLNFEAMITKFQMKQKEREELADRARIEHEEKLKRQRDEARLVSITKSRQVREINNAMYQSLKLSPIKESKKKTTPDGKVNSERKAQEKQRNAVAEATRLSIDAFESSLAFTIPPPPDQQGLLTFGEGLHSRDVEYLKRIKERLREENDAQKERQRRRRKVLVELLEIHRIEEEAKREEVLVNRLMRQSQQERRIVVQLMQMKSEKDVIRQNRVFLNKQYEERRVQEFEESLAREAKLAQLEKDQYQSRLIEEQEVHKRLIAEKEKRRYEKHYKFCYTMVEQIVDLSTVIGEYRKLTEQLIPPKMMREWKTLFLNGLPIYETISEKASTTEEQKTQPDTLDELDFSEYKTTTGEWHPSQDLLNIQSSLKENVILGHVVQKLYSIVYPPDVKPPPPTFPEFPIKACFLGKSFSGKTTIVNQLASRHRLRALTMTVLLNEAIEAYRNNETDDEDDGPTAAVDDVHEKSKALPTESTVAADGASTPEPTDQSRPATQSSVLAGIKEDNEEDARDTPPSLEEATKEEEPKLSLLARLGKAANRDMMNGQTVSDEILVEILVHAVRQVPEGTGWIIDGFPTSLPQAKILEKALTGYEPVKKGKTSEKGGAKGKFASKKKATLLPVKEVSESIVSPVSGIDVVILFDQSDEMSIKRSLGRKVNPQTGEEYHLELKEPPFGSVTGVQDAPLLVPVEDPNFDAQQVQNRLANFRDQWSKLKAWFSQFNNLVEVDSSRKSDEVCETVGQILTDLVESRKKAEEEKRAAEEAAKEAEAEAAAAAAAAAAVEADAAVAIATEAEEKQSHASLSAKGSSKPTSRRTSSVTPSPSVRDVGQAQQPPPPTQATESQADASAPPPPTAAPPMPEAGSEDWVYVDKTVEEDVAKVLALVWDEVEERYVISCKDTFRHVRVEREAIIQYLYSTKQSFFAFLHRPDHKQEFVTQFQKHYNEEISDDLRIDGDMKSQLHQEVEDLRERLWDISDRRREEAEDERQTVMNEQWLEDRLGLICNYYISLMQVEVDRYEDSLCLLRDYYFHVDGKPLGERRDYQRLPLVEIPEVEGPHTGEDEPDAKAEEEVPKPSAKTSVSGENAEETATENLPSRRIPLVRRRIASPEASADASASAGSKKHAGKKQQTTASAPVAAEEGEESAVPTSSDPDEQLLLEAHFSAVTAAKATSAKEEEVYGVGETASEAKEAAAQQVAKSAKGADKGKGKKKPKSPTTKKAGSGKKGGDKGRNMSRKSDFSVRSEVETPSLQTDAQSPGKEERTKVRMEHLAAVQIEENRLKFRLDLIKEKAIYLVQTLKREASQLWTVMDNSLGERFKQEMESIEQLCDFIRQAIENEEKILPAITLSGPDLLIDENTRTFEIPPPVRPHTPPENALPDTFTVVQLENLSEQLSEVAPSGVVSGRAFIQKMQELQSLSFGEEVMPELWSSMSPRKLEELAMMLVPSDADYLDWRHFLTLASLPWPKTTQASLLDTLRRFREVDSQGHGNLSQHDYMKVHLWYFSMPHDRSLPYDPSQPLTYDRDYNLKQAFFHIFKDKFDADGVEKVNYVNLLLNFCVDEDPVRGVFRALSVATGHPLPDPSVLDGEETSLSESTDFEIPLDSFINVLHLGKASLGFTHRFRDTTDPNDALSRDRVLRAYERHGAGEDKPLPFSVFVRDSVIRDCIHACKRYKKIDFRPLVAPDDTVILIQ
ncbi:sperm flagellar protein 2-like isoform X2 [Oscarella lobularis]|uniref:sperm flagellar protein 2-like isoform X2 n=1 Tax=Oscarella lobularis TaxID=121494 RepID=UPI0033134090